jgi:hypothetical protein
MKKGNSEASKVRILTKRIPLGTYTYRSNDTK